ncbi:Aste57867_18764 [Aphanomyces stellatus]|uniref:Aste57867_18764 protein n=1 Tax=Aphanomyces stellatus TaxID=120398 RepID=A0A485LAZ6_9STRA|nr:hypothetical protein As57867_018700 [Aphanomyces stellatus]VFT95498.1 Aste57867_18764 [Aphanomyces stellatus]
MWARWMSSHRRRACVFCDRTQIETNGILYEDERVLAFRDNHPRATVHVLVVPKEHIANTAALHSLHVPLVEHMLAVGKTVVDEECKRIQHTRPSSPYDHIMDHAELIVPRVFGFHQAPFNSIDHLHLHCLASPFLPSWNRFRYTEWACLQNFVSVATLLERLHDPSRRPSSI